MGHAALFPIRIDEPAGTPGDSARLSAELRLFRWTADCIQDGVVITAPSAESDLPLVFYANPAFRALSGLTPSDWSPQGIDAAESPHLPPRDDPLLRSLKESHQSDGVFSTDVVVCEENGCRAVLRLRSEPVCDPSGQVTHRIAVVRDITGQADLEEVGRRNERLACVGLLAAGIAHEINNPTGSALLAAETALAIMDSPNAGPEVAACLQNIVTSMDRCGRIVRTLLRYSREEPSEKQACSISDVAKQALELARPYAERHGAELRLELDLEAPLAPMNPLEIELVLVNLVRNAVEAGVGKGDRSNLCEAPAGPFRQIGPVPLSHVVITIRTQRTDEGVRVAVSDTGCGMTKEQLAHALDPLYTTRRQVGGSGLGMSIAYGIVQGHEGRMEVRSQPGMGTTVTIDLPVAAEKGTGPICRNGLEGASHKLDLSPFPPQPGEQRRWPES